MAADGVQVGPDVSVGGLGDGPELIEGNVDALGREDLHKIAFCAGMTT